MAGPEGANLHIKRVETWAVAADQPELFLLVLPSDILILQPSLCDSQDCFDFPISCARRLSSDVEDLGRWNGQAFPS